MRINFMPVLHDARFIRRKNIFQSLLMLDKRKRFNSVELQTYHTLFSIRLYSKTAVNLTKNPK